VWVQIFHHGLQRPLKCFLKDYLYIYSFQNTNDPVVDYGCSSNSRSDCSKFSKDCYKGANVAIVTHMNDLSHTVTRHVSCECVTKFCEYLQWNYCFTDWELPNIFKMKLQLNLQCLFNYKIHSINLNFFIIYKVLLYHHKLFYFNNKKFWIIDIWEIFHNPLYRHPCKNLEAIHNYFICKVNYFISFLITTFYAYNYLTSFLIFTSYAYKYLIPFPTHQHGYEKGYFQT